jgi:hypothetical protein
MVLVLLLLILLSFALLVFAAHPCPSQFVYMPVCMWIRVTFHLCYTRFFLCAMCGIFIEVSLCVLCTVRYVMTAEDDFRLCSTHGWDRILGAVCRAQHRYIQLFSSQGEGIGACELDSLTYVCV